MVSEFFFIHLLDFQNFRFWGLTGFTSTHRCEGPPKNEKKKKLIRFEKTYHWTTPIFGGCLKGPQGVLIRVVRWRLNVLKKFYGPICQIDDVITFQKSAHKIFSTHSVATGPGDLEPPRDPLNTPRIMAQSNGSVFQNELVLVKFYLRDHPAIIMHNMHIDMCIY